MRVLPPLTITDALLTSSTVPELAPAAYAGGTTYALGDQVSVAAGLILTVYQSLQAGNVGHTPASSPTWWVSLGTTYAPWSSGTTYAVGDVVLDATNHVEYTSLAASNLNHAVTDTAWWLSATSNRWRMFDLLRNTGATGPSPMTVVITPGQRIDSVGLVGLVADSATVTLTVAGMTVYSKTINLSSRNTTSWYTYFFGAFTFKSVVGLFDLPPYTNGVVSVTLTRAGGLVTCGGLLVGTSVYLGRTLYNPDNDALNFSTIDRDLFGNATLVQRRTVPKVNVQIRATKASVNSAIALRTLLNAVPALWSGLDDSEDAYFEPLLILGVYKRFTVNMDLPDYALITLELEEV
ncbi:hypothetical protein [Phenylobacterium sp.]|jgi:hypothetical protein|uniref:hypothetical protein n=1 Tax=Phenylobacterium sp. TaxID=1871053 RepID=UPI002F3EBCDC